MHIIQFKNDFFKIQVGIVIESKIFPLAIEKNFYELALDAIENRIPLIKYIQSIHRSPPIYFQDLIREKRLIHPIDHQNFDNIVISGTGLTHKNSSALRTEMNGNGQTTDAEKIYCAGVQNAKIKSGVAGVRPEWFLKVLDRS